MKKKVRLLIIGPLPPPAGGVSIHIIRLIELLQNDYDIDVIDESFLFKKQYFNFRSGNLFKYLNKILRSDVVFIHSGNHTFKKLHLIISKCFFKKTIVTFHGFGHKRKDKKFGFWERFIYKQSDKIIFVNKAIQSNLIFANNKCIVKHAFLPPIMSFEPELPSIISEWIKQARSQNQTIICSNASRLNIYNNQDLYGLDMCIEVVERLLKKGININLIFIVSSVEVGNDKFEEAKEKLRILGLTNNFLLLNNKLSFVKLIEQSDIVVRPTNTDGDALTIREAIFLHKPVLASDVVVRPEGTYTFKTRDINDFELKLMTLITLNATHSLNKEKDINEYSAFYQNLISSLVTKNSNTK